MNQQFEAWQRLRRHLELENARWREHDTARQERERDIKLVDESFRLKVVKSDSDAYPDEARSSPGFGSGDGNWR